MTTTTATELNSHPTTARERVELAWALQLLTIATDHALGRLHGAQREQAQVVDSSRTDGLTVAAHIVRKLSVSVTAVSVHVVIPAVQAGQWSKYGAVDEWRTVLIDSSHQVRAAGWGATAKAALATAKRRLTHQLEDELLRPLVHQALLAGIPEAAAVTDAAELEVGQLIGAHGHGRRRAAVVTGIARTGTVRFAFITPTELNRVQSRTRELVVTRGSAKANTLTR